jgi:uncharacterized protein
MKPSRFNIFIDTGHGSRLLFNSASAALAEIEPEKTAIVDRLLTDRILPQTATEKELRRQLIEGGYLVEDNLDEIAALKNENRNERLSGSDLMLTIAPTLACNFGCSYCFENSRPDRMNDTTQDALLSFSEKRLKAARGLTVTWFGGEPTLCLDIVEKLQNGLSEMAENLGVRINPAAIVTNGYLLNKKNALRLKAAGVTDVQITLDGPPEIHNARRMLKNGSATFDRIVENMVLSSEILNIVVRINIDRENEHAACEVLDFLNQKNVLDKIAVYFARVNPGGGVCTDLQEKCTTNEEFSRRQVDFYRHLIDNGIYNIEYPSLTPGSYCSADSANAFVVAPDGYLFKCWEEISDGPSRSVGTVFTDELDERQLNNRKIYSDWDPFEKKECLECDILPICLGGCPHQGIQDNNPSSGHCISWKYNLRDMMLLRYFCEQRKEVKP